MKEHYYLLNYKPNSGKILFVVKVRGNHIETLVRPDEKLRKILNAPFPEFGIGNDGKLFLPTGTSGYYSVMEITKESAKAFRK